MRVLKNLSEVEALVGKELGFSKWQRISQLQIWGFGLFTGDRQWIHMRPLKAKLGSPFKTTIAHGGTEVARTRRVCVLLARYEGIRVTSDS